MGWNIPEQPRRGWKPLLSDGGDSPQGSLLWTQEHLLGGTAKLVVRLGQLSPHKVLNIIYA